MPKNILWDMGGTLLDTYTDVDECLVNEVRRHGKTVELAEVSALTRISIAHGIEALAEKHRISAVDLEKAVDDMKARWESTPPPVAEGAIDVMEAVHRHGGLNLVITHRDRPSAELLIRKRHLTQIDDMICGTDGYARKPDPAMCLAMVKRHGLEKAQCLVVGDRPIDGESALAAGISAALLREHAELVDVNEGTGAGTGHENTRDIGDDDGAAEHRAAAGSPTIVYIDSLQDLLAFL